MIVWMTQNILTVFVALALSVGLALVLLPAAWHRVGRTVLYLWCAAQTLLFIYLLTQFRGEAAFDFSTYFPWVPELGLSYWLGLDGISLHFMTLTVLIVPVVIFLYLDSMQQAAKLALLPFLTAGLYVVWCSLDLLVLYMALELTTLGSYFFFRQRDAARNLPEFNQFIAFHILGSMALLASLMMASRYAGGVFDLASLSRMTMPAKQQSLWGAVFLLSLLVKLGILPFQLWVKHLHRQLLPAQWLWLTALLLKVGVYLYLRVGMGVFPQALVQYQNTLCWVAVVSALIGVALLWTEQNFFDQLAAFLMVQMGVLLVGMTQHSVASVEAVLLFVDAHSLLFVLLAILLSQQSQGEFALSRRQRSYGLLILLLCIGVPGSPFFIHWFIFFGTALSETMWLALGFVAAVFVASGLFYQSMLRMSWQVQVLRFRFRMTVIVTVLLLLCGGFVPQLFWEKSESSVTLWLSKVNPDIQLENL